MNSIAIYQGDSTDLIQVRPKIADPLETISNDWQCKTSVINSKGEVVVGPRDIIEKSEDDLYFIVGLSPGETLELSVDNGYYAQYSWVIQLSNATLEPAYSKEKHIPLNIRKQGVP